MEKLLEESSLFFSEISPPEKSCDNDEHIKVKDKSDDEYGDDRTDEMYQADSEDNAEWNGILEGWIEFYDGAYECDTNAYCPDSVAHVNVLVIEQVMVDHLRSMKNVKTWWTGLYNITYITY